MTDTDREKIRIDLKEVVKYSDKREMIINVRKDDLTRIEDLNLVVCNTYKNIKVWGTKDKRSANFNADYQMFILKTTYESEDTEQELLYPVLSALRLAQQSFKHVCNSNYSEHSSEIISVLLIDVGTYKNSERVRQFLSYYIANCKNLFIITSYKYGDNNEYQYELLNDEKFNSDKIFPLLPVSNEVFKNDFNFKPLDIFELSSSEFENDYLKIVIKSLLKQISNRNLENDIKQYIYHRLGLMTALARLIWLNMLNKIIDISKKEEKSHIIDAVFLRNTYFSAIEYADGISQILENSVLHSQGHIGFFSMRIYYVDFEATPSRAVQCAQYRQHITRKYNIRGNELFQSCSYMVEFTVIDYAISLKCDQTETFDESKKTYDESYGAGIVDTYIANNRNANLKEETLQEVYETYEDGHDVNALIYHLGIKLFKELINENSGIFKVISPRKNGTKDYAYYSFKKGKYKRKNVENKEINNVKGFTRYSIILPIREECPKLENSSKTIFSINDAVFTEKEIVSQEIEEIYEFPNTAQKENDINKVYEYYKSQIDNLATDKIVIPVISLTLRNTFMGECERLAKVSLLLQEYLKSDNNYLAINFICDNEDIANYAIGYFLRIYATFFKKTTNKEIEFLEKSQIALFVTIKKDKMVGNMIHVIDILGQSISDLYNIAEHYVYSGSPFALEQAAQLKYLVEEKNGEDVKNRRELRIFPFDLFVNDITSEYSDSVFISSIRNTLSQEVDCGNKNFNNFRNGVCISDTHVALSSGIHIDKFYQAELLFYKNIIIKKFAVLIARDLILRIREKNYVDDIKNGIIIIGYENYSHVLTEQVTEFLDNYVNNYDCGVGNVLGKKNFPKAIYGTFAGHNSIVNGIKTRVVPRFRLQHIMINEGEFKREIRLKDLMNSNKRPLVVIIEPIGTSLNTIVQIRHAFQVNECIDEKLNSINYCLIISAPFNKNIKGKETNFDGLEIRAHYCANSCDKLENYHKRSYLCKQCDRDEECIRNESFPILDKFGSIRLRKENINSCGQTVQFLIHVDCNWFSYTNCPMCNKDVALDWVDKTSTSTYLIHELLNNKKKGITYALDKKSSGSNQSKYAQNQKRLGFLKGNIVYGHTKTQNNHFLFNLDLKHLLESNNFLSKEDNYTCREDVEEWLKTLKLNTAAFNILISPMHERNSPFVRMVSELALKQNIRFIHFDVMATPREMTRTHFAYVASEISLILKNNPRNHINIYYCDDSNVSGESIQRAILIMKMILDEAEVSKEDIENRIHLFKSLIFLVNRSSYESLQQFVNNPNEDVYAYIHLGVPNYNTKQDICYDCNFIKKLELQKKRTVSSLDAADIERLIFKHRLLTVQQFWEVIEREVFSSSKYVKWLKSWRLLNPSFNLPAEMVEIFAELQKQTVAIATKYEKDNHEALNTIIKQINEITLDSLVQNIKDKDKIWQFMKNYVIADRYYMRLICTHNLHCVLEHVAREKKTKDELYQNTLLAILELLLEERTRILKDWSKENKDCKIDSPKGKQRFLVYYCELLISYIKIMSREQLVRFYHVRQVVIDIMKFILISFLDGFKQAKDNARETNRLSKNEDEIFDLYKRILDGLIFSNMDRENNDKKSQENSLNAGSQAFLVISLIKKIANLDSTFFMGRNDEQSKLDICRFSNIWIEAVNKYFDCGKESYTSEYYDVKDKNELMSLTTMPSFDYCINVYQNALRWVLLTTYDGEGKSYLVERIYNNEKEKKDE